MRNLVLAALTKSLYNDNIAHAYIYFGTKDKPQDPADDPITTFYQSPAKLRDYLSANVLPIIDQGLKYSKYKAMDVSFENQAPHPFITIMRRDHGTITDQDLKNLNKKLEQIIKAHSRMSSSNIFQKEKSSQPESQSNHHAMQLRAKR